MVAETITFKRSLRLFDRFDIVTEVVGWDERSMYLKQDFSRGGTLVASGLIRGRFLGRDGARITPEQVVALADEPVERPELPAWVVAWAEATEIRSAQPVPLAGAGGTVASDEPEVPAPVG